MFWKWVVVAVLVFAAVFASGNSCVSAQKDSEILVSAAISLKNAFEEIGAMFEKQTGIRVRFNWSFGIAREADRSRGPSRHFCERWGKADE